MVKKEVAEALHESDVEFDDSPYEPIKKKFKPVDDIDKAFTDERVATPQQGSKPPKPKMMSLSRRLMNLTGV